MSQNTNNHQNVVTILLPNGDRIHASKIAFVALDAGKNTEPQNGHQCAVVHGEFSLHELAGMHKHMEQTLMEAGQKLIDQVVKAKGPDAAFEMMIDGLADHIASSIVNNMQDPEKMAQVAKLFRVK